MARILLRGSLVNKNYVMININMDDVSVVVPTLNNIDGIRYLADYFRDKKSHLIVIDNHPTEEKRKFLKHYVYLPQGKNLGFAAAVNLGVKHIKTRWVVVLNDDIEFKDGLFFTELLHDAKKRRLDAVSPILINPDGRIENYGYRVLPYGRVELVTDQEDRRIDGLTAACLLIKTETFRKLGGFDKKFFAYLEDVDFFLRFKKKGYRMSMSRVEVKHNHMTTSRTMGNFKARQDMVNWWRLYFKNKGFFKFDSKFLVERLRNVSGYLKATFNSG